ncbi:hypothetical protein [Eubacterium maltosivorans]|uniref:Uncharacterized protein n=1 Tax=Eubacterium maltosivorans TaxID=2041044 RepID=A0A4P9C8X1_EUBML|nr:hypothetical protein [Eubacterium maltosivorans]QCT71092.1 hypothetical protein CPZ25_007045 [Eubacterium maltosivorans]
MRDYARKPEMVKAEKITKENYLELAKENKCQVSIDKENYFLVYKPESGPTVITDFGRYLIDRSGELTQMHADMFESLYAKA